ncbi:uncharacterized protein BXZ73DRAFT_24234, partial [Epithele typhae]|uniref:uncharacterized protein n=1 Tax=Epithele typhae TaxID=378194 RepID=UPI00200776B4
MAGTNEDFDLPRWHTQSIHDPLSSSAQAAQAAAQAPYLYNAGPPPQAANRLPPIQQPPSGSSRQPRINQLLDEDHQFGVNQSPYTTSGLARSLSLGGSAATNSSRGRRHHMQDDLEGAFHVEGDGAQRQTPASLYPSSVAYHSQQTGAGPNPSAAATGGDPYQDAYFTGPGVHTPKRSQTQHESGSSRAPRSPQRSQGGNSYLDPYSPPQNNYSSTNNYPYSPTGDVKPFAGGGGGGGYSSQTHSRSQSQAKGEPMSPRVPPPSYSPQTSGHYTGPYPMDTTSPAPSNNALSARHPRQ